MPKRHKPKSSHRPEHRPLEEHDAELASILIRRQAKLAIGTAAVFLIGMLILPLLNAFWPSGMQARILGFPASWLFLGVLSYPITWLLAGYFVKRSEVLEDDDARLARSIRSHRL